MVEINITKMSSKGQIVIPIEMRKDFSINERFILIRNRDQIILKRATDFNKELEEDLIFAKKTEEAFRRYERGKSKKKSDKEFLEELNKW
ncbi:MAG: AbrB/MazE/SpoVT family DNA-binding domain-containing protein [Nanoarchaeota archaeon]